MKIIIKIGNQFRITARMIKNRDKTKTKINSNNKRVPMCLIIKIKYYKDPITKNLKIHQIYIPISLQTAKAPSC